MQYQKKSNILQKRKSSNLKITLLWVEGIHLVPEDT